MIISRIQKSETSLNILSEQAVITLESSSEFNTVLVILVRNHLSLKLKFKIIFENKI